MIEAEYRYCGSCGAKEGEDDGSGKPIQLVWVDNSKIYNGCEKVLGPIGRLCPSCTGEMFGKRSRDATLDDWTVKNASNIFFDDADVMYQVESALSSCGIPFWSVRYGAILLRQYGSVACHSVKFWLRGVTKAVRFSINEDSPWLNGDQFGDGRPLIHMADGPKMDLTVLLSEVHDWVYEFAHMVREGKDRFEPPTSIAEQYKENWENIWKKEGSVYVWTEAGRVQGDRLESTHYGAST